MTLKAFRWAGSSQGLVLKQWLLRRFYLNAVWDVGLFVLLPLNHASLFHWNMWRKTPGFQVDINLSQFKSSTKAQRFQILYITAGMCSAWNGAHCLKRSRRNTALLLSTLFLTTVSLSRLTRLVNSRCWQLRIAGKKKKLSLTRALIDKNSDLQSPEVTQTAPSGSAVP